jgi:hypothetical protein
VRVLKKAIFFFFWNKRCNEQVDAAIMPGSMTDQIATSLFEGVNDILYWSAKGLSQ